MRRIFYSLCLFLVCCSLQGWAQGTVSGNITDEDGSPLPFVAIKLGDSRQGSVADINGHFSIKYPAGINYLECVFVGYKPQKVALPANSPVTIKMVPGGRELTEVVVKPPYEKIKRILNKAIDNGYMHNPEKYDWYQCKVYYKMTVPFSLPGNIADTSADTRKIKELSEQMNMMMSETYSRRTWKRPQKLQEEVIATRFSGLKKSLFTSLVTDVLPFHAYGDFLNLNGYDYHNPVSKGFFGRYHLNIIDEVVSGRDTIWAISFKPKHGAKELKGVVYINSDEYAIADIVAQVPDSQIKRNTRIEQQYSKESGRWFPKQLIYVTDFTLSSKDSTDMHVLVKGFSQIDSVHFTEDSHFNFDKSHTVKLLPGADIRNDSFLTAIRPVALDAKDMRTYKVVDSFAESQHIDRYIPYAQKIISELKFPVGWVDVDLRRIIRQNRYERTRLGIGLQTNEEIVKWASVGGWVGYGIKDKKAKYGGFMEFYADQYKETVVKLSYDNDIVDPGRVLLHHDLDKNFFRNFLLSRVDKNEQVAASIRKQMGYLSAELSVRYQKITPQYDYMFVPEGGISYNQFTAREVNLSLRYAFAERSVPAFGKYFRKSIKTPKYPIFYARINAGHISATGWASDYQQVLGSVKWIKHINRLGIEHYQITGGYSHSKNPLPVSKLFAGNGYNNGTFYSSIYTFGGLRTMSPYGYYTDRFVSFSFQHDFDFRFFSAVIRKGKLSTAPSPSLAYNAMVGGLNNRAAQEVIDFKVPVNGYHEAGFLVRNVFKSVYMDLLYISLSAGYFYHITPDGLPKDNGKFVFGISTEF